MNNHETTEEIFDLLTTDEEVKRVYDRQEAIIKIAELVKALRTNAGMTQSELAREIGTKQTVISRMESYNSDNMPNFERIIKIVHACGRELSINASSSIQHAEPAGSVVNSISTESVQVAF